MGRIESNRRRTRWAAVALATAVATVSGCTSLVRIGPNSDLKAYGGNGSIALLARHYGPGMETHGYLLELPVFTGAKDFQKEYSLAGLPKWDRTALVEIITFLPEEPMHDWQAAGIAPEFPAQHSLSCAVIDARTGSVIAEREAGLTRLENTRSLHFRRATFVKHLLSVDLRTLSSTDNLILRLSYRNGGRPTDEKMCLVIIVDAPTA